MAPYIEIVESRTMFMWQSNVKQNVVFNSINLLSLSF